MFSGLYPIRMAVSEDDGGTWTPLRPIGDFGGVVAMASVERLKNGDYMALFHDDGRFLRGLGKRTKFRVYKTISKDGGLTWGPPVVIAEHPVAHLCEPGLIRSPDGRQIAVLLRENSRKLNSFVIFSDDEGKTWTGPRELPAALTGDRHTGKYAPDGRLFITFRDTTRSSPTSGDWVGWVGTYIPRTRTAARRHVCHHYLRSLAKRRGALYCQRPLQNPGARRHRGLKRPQADRCLCQRRRWLPYLSNSLHYGHSEGNAAGIL